MKKGVLFVLLAFCSVIPFPEANARDTSITPIEINAKKEAVVVVSILDSVAFTEADTASLNRYLKKVLPRHKVVQITATTSVAFSGLAQPHQIQEVRESLKKQIETKITNDFKISHLVIMDHGSTSFEQDAKTSFKFLSTFGKDGVDRKFKEIFDPLVGKFTKNAFIMMESCLTVTDGPVASQERVRELMEYFQIPNGTVFGAYQEMVSQGYEAGFRLRQLGIQMKHPLYIAAAIQLGLLTQLDVLLSGATFSFSELILTTVGVDIAIPIAMKFLNYFKKQLQTVNWGYLFKFESGNVKKVFEINPYENQNELFMRVEPKKVKAQVNTCYSLFG